MQQDPSVAVFLFFGLRIFCSQLLSFLEFKLKCDCAAILFDSRNMQTLAKTFQKSAD